MKNIELKISIDDFGEILPLLKKIGAEYKSKMNQIDTYYDCGSGRLKVREINNEKFELIIYERPNELESKVSDYCVFNIEKSQLRSLKFLLRKIFGEKSVVKKERDLWMYKNTRIHLDKVKGLGNFLELETLVNGNFQERESEHNEVIDKLNLHKYKKYKGSYIDIFLQSHVTK